MRIDIDFRIIDHVIDICAELVFAHSIVPVQILGPDSMLMYPDPDPGGVPSRLDACQLRSDLGKVRSSRIRSVVPDFRRSTYACAFVDADCIRLHGKH